MPQGWRSLNESGNLHGKQKTFNGNRKIHTHTHTQLVQNHSSGVCIMGVYLGGHQLTIDFSVTGREGRGFWLFGMVSVSGSSGSR